MGKIYKVWLQVEAVDADASQVEKDSNRFELAVFDTLEEALIYKTTIERIYSPLATGEKEVLDPLISPEQFTAGD